MRIYPKVLIILLAVFFLSAGAFAIDLRFRVSGGLGYTDGGDLSRSISARRSYYQSRQGGGFSSSYDLGEMHWTEEFDAEAVLTLSRRWSLSLGVGYVRQGTRGEVTTRLTQHDDITVSPSEHWTVDFEETTQQNPVYTKSTVPITVGLDHSLELTPRWTLVLGGGAGIYVGRLNLRESYDVQSRSISNQQTGNGVVQLIDFLSTVGDYSEKTKSVAFGLHGRVGLNLKLGPSTFLSITVLGRWVDMKGWKGTRHDASSWQWTYGLWGANSAEGTDERTEDGEYWTYDLGDEKSGKSYPILAFRDTKPSPSSKSANFNLTGISMRVGLGFRFGGKG